MKASDIANRLMRGSWQKDFVLPAYTPAGWFECDVFHLRPSGRWTEYEIKLDFRDFQRDAGKSRENGFSRLIGEPRTIEKKHDVLANGSRGSGQPGPNYFYFVTPKGMLSDANIPAWAGVIEFEEVDSAAYGRPPTGRMEIHTRQYREAPKRHTAKIDPKIREHALGVCYYRYHHLRHAGGA